MTGKHFRRVLLGSFWGAFLIVSISTPLVAGELPNVIGNSVYVHGNHSVTGNTVIESTASSDGIARLIYSGAPIGGGGPYPQGVVTIKNGGTLTVQSSHQNRQGLLTLMNNPSSGYFDSELNIENGGAAVFGAGGGLEVGGTVNVSGGRLDFLDGSFFTYPTKDNPNSSKTCIWLYGDSVMNIHNITESSIKDLLATTSTYSGPGGTDVINLYGATSGFSTSGNGIVRLHNTNAVFTEDIDYSVGRSFILGPAYGTLEVWGNAEFQRDVLAASVRVANGGEATFGDGSSYSGVTETSIVGTVTTYKGAEVEGGGTLNIHNMTAGHAKGLLDNTTLKNGGVINLFGPVTGFSLDSSSESGGTVALKNNAVFSHLVMLGASWNNSLMANLNALGVDATFGGGIRANTITVDKIVNIHGGNARTLAVQNGVTTLYDDFAVGSFLNVSSGAKVVNTGALSTPGLLTNAGVIDNSGAVSSTGSFTNTGSFINRNGALLEGVINNGGVLENKAGAAVAANVQNSGTLTNAGDISTHVVNTGHVDNTGSMKMTAASTGTWTNSATGTLNFSNGVYTNSAASQQNFGTIGFDVLANPNEFQHTGSLTATKVDNSGRFENNGAAVTAAVDNTGGAEWVNTGTLTVNSSFSKNTGHFGNSGHFENRGTVNFVTDSLQKLTFSGNGTFDNAGAIFFSNSNFSNMNEMPGLDSFLATVNQTSAGSEIHLAGAAGYSQYAYQIDPRYAGAPTDYVLKDSVAGSKLFFDAVANPGAGITYHPYTTLAVNVDAKNSDIVFTTDTTRWEKGNTLRTSGTVQIRPEATLWYDGEGWSLNFDPDDFSMEWVSEPGKIYAGRMLVEGALSLLDTAFSGSSWGNVIELADGGFEFANGSLLRANQWSTLSAPSPKPGQYGFKFDPGAVFELQVTAMGLEYDYGGDAEWYSGPSSSILTLHGTMAPGSLGSQNVRLVSHDPSDPLDLRPALDPTAYNLERLRLTAVDDPSYIADSPTGQLTWDGAAIPGGYHLGKSADGKILIITASGGSVPPLPDSDLTWTNAMGSGVWDVGSTRNWSGVAGGVAVERFLDGDNVVFTNAGASDITVVAATGGKVGVTNMSVENAVGSDYSFNGDGIAGAGSLTKKGAGTAVFANNASFAGGVSVEAGVLGIGNGGASGAIGSDISLASGSVLRFNRSNEYTHASDITGNGKIEQAGSGTVVLAGSSLQAGQVDVSSGALCVADGKQIVVSEALTVRNGASLNLSVDATPSVLAGSVVFETGSKLNITSVDATVLGQSITVISSDTAVSTVPAHTIGGSSSVDYLKSNISLTNGNKDIAVAVDLTWRNTSQSGGQFDEAHGTFTVADSFELNATLADRPGTFSSGWDGKSLTKEGAGTLVLLADNVYSGDTSINDGSLILSGNGSIAASKGVSVATDATFDVSGITHTTSVKELSGTGSVSLGAKNLAVGGGNTSTTFSGVISGAGGTLIKEGTGTLTLTGNNSYTGMTILSGGTLVGNTASLRGNLVNNAAVVFDQAFASTFENTVTGTGTFTKTSAGALTLANNLTQGNVNLDAGELALAAGKNITATAAFNAAAGTTVAVSAANGGNTITAGTATFANGAKLTADLTGAASGATILTFGPSTALTFGGAIDVNATFTGAVNGTYTIIDTGGSTFDFASKFTGRVNGVAASGMLGPNIRYGGSAYDDSTLGKLMLTVSGVDVNRDATWTNAFGNGQWDETSNNWDLAGSPLHVFKNGDTAIFGDASAGSVAVGLGLSAAGMTVNNSAGNDYTFTGDGLAATGAFTKTGTGTVTFNQTAANTFTSASLDAGRVNLNRDDALGAGQVTLGNAVLGLADTLNLANNVAVSGSGSVAVESSGDSATISGVISGGGSLIKTGDGSLVLSETNTHTGDIRLDEGALVLTGTGSIASSNGLIMEAGTTLDISGIAGSASVKTISMAGGATIVGGGNVLNMTGTDNTLSFDLSGITSGSPALLDGGGALQVSGSTILDILSPTVLAKGEQVALAENLNASSTFTAGIIKSNRMKYDILLDGSYTLLATFLGTASYREDSDEKFGPLALNNINLRSGADHLDSLEQASFDPAVMNALDQAYTDSINLGGRNASLALQQMYGASVVYNAAVQSVTGSRFRQLLGNRNHGGIVNVIEFAGAPRNFFNDAGIASDDAFASPHYGARDTVPVGRSRIWASGFGAWARQDSSASLAGFKYDAQGAAIGYEYTVANCLQFGVAAAYARGDLKVNDLRYTNKPDIMNLALYGIYAHESGVYVQGSLGYGHAWNDYTTNMLLGGRKKGKYGSDEWSANLELGYVARLPQNFNFVPSVGLEYTYLRNSGWKERVSGNPALVANRFDGDHDSSVDIPLGFRLNKLFAFGYNGGYIVPEVRASWVYMADKSRPSVSAGFVSAPGSATMRGVNPGSNFWRLGAGVSGRFNERVDFRVDYDFDTRSGFRGHTVNASVGLSF